MDKTCCREKEVIVSVKGNKRKRNYFLMSCGIVVLLAIVFSITAWSRFDSKLEKEKIKAQEEIVIEILEVVSTCKALPIQYAGQTITLARLECLKNEK